MAGIMYSADFRKFPKVFFTPHLMGVTANGW
jgi:phosphoglycerate dehydrogenase-like enzyme